LLHHPSKNSNWHGKFEREEHVHLIELLVDLLNLFQIREQLPHHGAVREREQLWVLQPTKQKGARRSEQRQIQCLGTGVLTRNGSGAYDAVDAGEERVAGLGGRERRHRGL
jgi:hypothetical protein